MRIIASAAQTFRWSIASDGAARGRTERAAVVIEVRTERGAVGLGEAAPLPGMSSDTVGDAARAAGLLAMRVPIELDDPDAALALAQEISHAATTGGAPAACFAIETALLDALAREQGVSLATLLRARLAAPPTTGPAPQVLATSAPRAGSRSAVAALAAEADRAVAPRVPLAAVVDDPAAARDAFARGIRSFKIKATASDAPDHVHAIASAVPGARLRIDANRSWPRAEVLARLSRLAGLPIDYVEEPCVNAQALLSALLPCPLALDESLPTLAPEALAAALRSPQLAAVVLKPTLLGLSGALAIAAQARAAGVAAIASHGLEGPIGTAACAELALALGGPHAAGLAPHAALAGWQIEVLQLAADHVRAAPAAGLGFAGVDLADVVRAAPGS